MARKTKADKAFDRAFWDWCCADDVMGVINRKLSDSVFRDDMMKVHLHLVYHYAHHENERIDFDVANASWLKPKPDSIAGRIVARRAAKLEVA